MAYLVTDLRKVVKGYFFEVDNLGSAIEEWLIK